MIYEFLCGVLILVAVAMGLLLRGAFERNRQLAQEKLHACEHVAIGFKMLSKSIKDCNAVKRELLEVKKQDKFIRVKMRETINQRRDDRRLVRHYEREYKLLMDSWTKLRQDLAKQNINYTGDFINDLASRLTNEEIARRNNQTIKPVYPWGELS